MKVFLAVVAGLIALFFIGSLVIAASLGSIVKRGLDLYGPQYTQTTVTLGSAEISPLSGQGTLKQLFVGNPTGWVSNHAFSLGKISVDVQPRSLFGDHVIVNSLVIDQPDIIYETKVTSSNLQDLLKNIQRANGNQEAQASAEEKKPKKIEVRSLKLENTKITLIAGGRTQVVNVPSIALENLGTREGGLTPAGLAAAIVKEISRQALQATTHRLLNLGPIDKAADSLLKIFGSGKNSSPTTSESSN